MKISKQLNSYINQLIFVGIGIFCGGLILSIILLNSRDYLSDYYIPFKLIPVILVILLVIKLNPGGNVNYHIADKGRNEDEQKLNSLIAKYKNDNTIILTAIFYILANIYIINIYKKSSLFSINDGIFLFLLNFLAVLGLCEGIKYINAWINIKRNWKKEFNS